MAGIGRNVPAAAYGPDLAFECAAIGMATIDLQGRFLRVNPALCELVGRPAQELLGMTWQSVTHSEDVERGERRVAEAVAGAAGSFRLAKRYLRSDGGVVWVELSGSLIRSGSGQPPVLFTQAIDISEQRRAGEDLSRLASILESSEDAILSNGLDGTILGWNRAAERMYGYTAAEMVGRSMFAIVPEDRKDEARRLLDSVRRGQSIRNHETTRLRKDGSPIDVSITSVPVRDGSGTIASASSIARDITERRRMEGELAATMACLEVARGEAREAEARNRQFLSDAAHHLRNPIAGILGCAEALRRGCPSAESERLVAEMARETYRASQLVDRLLRMSRLDDGERLVLENSDLVAVCRAAVERTESLAPHLRIVMDGEGPYWLNLDRGAAQKILDNLLDNARRHAVEWIALTVGPTDGMVSVRVADDGPGLPPTMLERAFAPFVNLDGMGGFGLGLAFSRALARAHEGDLTYEDGSFVLRLPDSRET